MSGDPSALILNLAFSGSYLSRVGSSSTAPWTPSVHQLGSKRSDEASGKVSQQATAHNKSLLCLNDLPNTSHAYGRSRLCMR
jgi:hypothetical protein